MRVANQRHLSEDRDPGPDSFFHFNAISDPNFTSMWIRMILLLIIVMRIWDH
jgi:hypothetical protein